MQKVIKDAIKGYEKGKCQKISNCCREIRLTGLCSNIRDIVTGFNTITEQAETWVIITNPKKSEWVLMQIFKS